MSKILFIITILIILFGCGKKSVQYTNLKIEKNIIVNL